MMKLADRFTKGPKGTFACQLVDHETGKVIQDWENHNIIVLQAQSALLGAVCLPSANFTISVIKIGNDLGELSTTGSVSVTFAVASGGNGPTITRASGSWITDGFVVGDNITITGTASNNTTGTIGVLTATVMTLVTTDTLVAETTTSCVISRGIGTAPSAPMDTYNQNTMAATSLSGAILFTSPSTLACSASNPTTYVFNTTLSGSTVIAAQPAGTQSVNMSSAALHTGNGNVFSYTRFAQKSISALIDINVSWTIEWAT